MGVPRSLWHWTRNTVSTAIMLPDFADGVIQAEAGRARCNRPVCFDKNFGRLSAGIEVIRQPGHNPR
jgi:hypothetical protein